MTNDEKTAQIVVSYDKVAEMRKNHRKSCEMCKKAQLVYKCAKMQRFQNLSHEIEIRYGKTI